MAWYSRARSSFRAAMSSFRVKVFAVEDCGASFISLSFYGSALPSNSSTIDRLICTDTLPAQFSDVKSLSITDNRLQAGGLRQGRTVHVRSPFRRSKVTRE